jgi:hypothetical protein
MKIIEFHEVATVTSRFYLLKQNVNALTINRPFKLEKSQK